MKLINFCIVYLAAQIGNKIECDKARIKVRILEWKEKRNKISRDECIKRENTVVDDYAKWQNKSMERVENAIIYLFSR